MEIGRCKLPELLAKKGLLQNQLAEMVRLSRKQISDYATRRRIMSLKNAKIISGALGCRMEDLYEWIDDNKRGLE